MHVLPVQVVEVTGVPPHGRTPIENDGGAVTVPVPPATSRDIVLTTSLVGLKTSLPLRVAR